jgi:hypothetical protein
LAGLVETAAVMDFERQTNWRDLDFACVFLSDGKNAPIEV